MAGSSMSATKLLSAVLKKGSGPRMLASTLPLRSGMGMPVGTRPPPSQPLPEDHELEWDDGSPFPEPCVDHVAPMVGKVFVLMLVFS
ncbi:hypothetical protein O6H91_Y547800 [Diphasiastrum complanatum]|nr:hypothetical protein O6H91_Y547800 [Diphasiastrum complanatum]